MAKPPIPPGPAPAAPAAPVAADPLPSHGGRFVFDPETGTLVPQPKGPQE